MKRQWLKRLLIGTAITLVVLVVAAVGVRSLLRGMMEGKSVHKLQATVIRKEHLHFDEQNHSYVDDVNFTWNEPVRK